MSNATQAVHDTSEHTSLRDRAADTVRQAAQVAQEARRLKGLATDVVEDSFRTVKRGIKRGVHDFEDARDTTAYRIKRAPFQTVALAAGGGFLFGAAFAWVTTRMTSRHSSNGKEAESPLLL